MESVLRRCGLTLGASPDEMVVTTPGDFEVLSPGTGGAIYGKANHGLTATLTRQGVRSALQGLYLTGGSVHPGAGVPMVTLSGRLAAEAIEADHASTLWSIPMATRGGISTR